MALTRPIDDFAPESPLVAPHDPANTDGTTLATIEVTEHDGTVTTVPNITAFSYSSDVQQVGDPFAVTVPDPRLIYVRAPGAPQDPAAANGGVDYRPRLAKGSGVVFSLSSPFVAGGAKVKKISGLIVHREVSVTESGGTIITIQGADKGWHLVNNDGPLWFGLRSSTMDELARALIHPDAAFPGTPDPKWGFAETVAYSNVLFTIARQALRQGKAGVRLEQQGTALVPLARIQIEPGEKLYDTLSLYARRFNLFVGVSPDGQLVLFGPRSFDSPPDYHFSCYPVGERGTIPNNVDAAGITLTEDITEIWTDILAVGEIPLPDLADAAKAQDDVNANKFVGPASFPNALPFRHFIVFGDGESMDSGFAKSRANWKGGMGLFNSHVLKFTVRDHHQGGIFYESDTIASLDFPVIGVRGNYYISAVHCTRDEQGDRTEFTTHLPGFLTAFVPRVQP